MELKQIDHLAFITKDIEKTIRFYRDLLGMELEVGIGTHGYRHYFFKTADNYIAFFQYEEARPMEIKPHGKPTAKPLGFDHVAFGVASKEDLFHLKDKLEAAGLEVRGAIDHGIIWSIYFFDPNNIPLEAAWSCLEVTKFPAVLDDEPLDIVSEGSGPQPDIWPKVTQPTPPQEMTAQPGAAFAMREYFLKQGWAVAKPNLS
ncbi:MAG: VOC family protein [Nitrospinales bacterium]